MSLTTVTSAKPREVLTPRARITASNPIPWAAPEDKRIGLIDGDGVLFAAALEGQADCDGEVLQMLDNEAIHRRCIERLEAQAELLGDCPQVFLCLSDRLCFRKRILPTYKDNRKKSSRPVALDWLRNEIAGEGRDGGFPVFLISDLEADDVCGIMATKFQADGYETCIISPDKDMLTIPGMSVTPKGEFSEVTEERADREHLYQALIGDSVDNYKGCPGVGPVKADALLDFCEGMSKQDTWEFVVSAFEAVGLTEEDALVQARVARILRSCDWDFTNKEVKLWEPTR